MLSGSQRICDRCGGGIPLGAFYRTVYCKPAVAGAYLGLPAASRPADEPNGTIRIDLCRECAAAMGG